MRPGPSDKGVSWEELFFDLAFVFALTQFSQLLHEDHGWAGIGRVLILFVPVYWAWGGVTLYINQRDTDAVVDRVGVFTLGFASLLMALTIPGAYEDHGLLFVGVYIASRALLAVLALRKRLSWRNLLVGPYVFFLLVGPLLVAGALMDGAPRIAFWAVAATVDLLSPWVVRHLTTQPRAQPVHYTHRYGLLIILVLGESVIEVGAVSVDGELNPVRLTAIGAAYAMVGVLAWLYFGFGLPDFRQALERAADQVDLRRAILVYGHLLFSFGIIAIAVGLADTVPAPLDPLPIREAMLLFGGCALFLGAFAYAHWRIHRTIAWRRIGGTVACLLLVPPAMVMPALAGVVCLILVVALVAAAEQLAVRRQGGDAAGGSAGYRPFSDEDPDSGPATAGV
ncbi:low temperature requirement protein A [Micromonospora musae]|uniref:Low temperature requirement protein A n=1 Tax=Micromonospora musae TaxID=1894970 RepID=A0ABX9RE48_9ACTN|nr:low temperature requirement protein A [Micromonospora musae]